MRYAVQEIWGPIDRIDDEAMRFVGAFDHAGFLDQKAITGPRATQFLRHRDNRRPGDAALTTLTDNRHLTTDH